MENNNQNAKVSATNPAAPLSDNLTPVSPIPIVEPPESASAPPRAAAPTPVAPAPAPSAAARVGPSPPASPKDAIGASMAAPAPQQISGQVGPSAKIKRSGIPVLKIILVILLVLVLAGFIFFLFFYRATIVVNPTPAPDKITLDGKQVKPGTYKVMPGVHLLEVAKEGYVSLNLNKKFSTNEKYNFTGKLVAAVKPELVDGAGELPRLSANGKAVNFVKGSGKLAELTFNSSGKIAIEELSVGSYQGVREVLFSADNKFALILDQSNLRLLDFTKRDLVNQTEAVLPPAASTISSVTWNATASSSFAKPNSRILYDLKSSYAWDLITADRNHQNSDIAMQIENEGFDNLRLDWSQSEREILVVGGSACTFDIVSRTNCQSVSDKKDFVWGQWGLGGKYAILIDKGDEAWLLKNGQVQDLNIKSGINLISWISANEAYFEVEGRVVRVNFDTGVRINYADIEGLKSATSFAVLDNQVVFSDSQGLKKAVLEENSY